MQRPGLGQSVQAPWQQTHYVLGEALDRDPFLLFAAAGPYKEQVLDALRAREAGPPYEREPRRQGRKQTPPKSAEAEIQR